MANFGPEIANAVISLEVDLESQQINAAAAKAAAQFNRQFAAAQKVLSARSQASQAAAAASVAAAFGGMFKQFSVGTPKLNAFQKANAAVTKGVSSLSSVSAGAAVAIAALTTAVVAVGIQMAKSAANFQELEVSLNAIINTSTTARTTSDEFIGSLQRLALQSGRSSAQLANTGRQFLALGFSGAQTTSILETFAKAASFTGASNQQLGLALNGVAQIASKGVVSMEELRRQIAENLPGAVDLSRFFEILGITMGKTTEEVRKLQEQGLIPADIGIKALQQTVDEATAGIDVFALRASTLNGLMGILQEAFTQAVQVGFKPFIDIITQADGPIGQVIASLRGLGETSTGIGGGLSGLQGMIERFAEVLGTSFVDIVNEIIPLLPLVAELFISLTEALAPVVVEAVKVFATVGKLVIPIMIVLAKTIDLLLNKLGPLSTVLRFIATSILVGGVFKAFALLGRALGSIGGLVGRLATPVSKLASGLASLAPLATRLAGVFQILRVPIDALFNSLDNIGGAVSRAIGFLSRLPGVEQVVGIIGGITDSEANAERQTNSLSGGFKNLGRAIRSMGEIADSALTPLNKSLLDAIDKQEDLKKAQDAVRDAEETLLASRQNLVDTTEDLKDAQVDLADANLKLQEIVAELNTLEAERQELLADTARDIREIADAQRDLERIGFRLLGIDQDRADILEQIAELQNEDLGDEKAAADRRITRATIAYNRALRDQAELLASLNEEQESSIDLSNLTLDQLRGRLAGLRLEAAAQRAKDKSGKSQAEIDEDIALAGLSVLETQAELNEAVQGRADLDLQIIENQETIVRLNGRLRQLELDRLDLLDDQVEAEQELIGLQNGETTRLAEIRKIEVDIKTLKDQERAAVRDIETVQINIRNINSEIREATRVIRQNEIDIRDAKLTQRQVIAEQLGDERALNSVLLERIGFNNRLVGQSAQLLLASLQSNPEFLNTFLQKAHPRGPGGATAPSAKGLADLILNNPNALRDLLRQLGVSGFEHGGLITSPTLANMGEKFKHEMVLPLSNPDRVWSLMSQHLPRYPGALAAAQAAISPSLSVPQLSKVVSSGNRAQSRSDGPATYGQIQELIEAIKSYEPSFKVDAPITVSSNGLDEDALVKKLSKKLERDVLTRLSRR